MEVSRGLGIVTFLNVDPGINSTGSESLVPITCKYLLVVNIPLYRESGELLVGHLWFKDLASHTPYLERLTIACPILDRPPSEPVESLSADHRLGAIDVVELPASSSVFQALLSLPRTTIRLWRAIRDADVVHAGIAGWPIPYGWLVTPIAKILGKKLLIIVESAPWRLNAGRPRIARAVLTAGVFEALARWCVGRSDLAVFTQENYRDSLLGHRRNTGHIIHASWIDAEVIISDEQALEIWRSKSASDPPEFYLIFAGRLDRQKGLAVLLDAMRRIARANLPIRLDILGSGDLAPACRELSDQLAGATRVRLLGTVPYGPPLFELLRRYHAMIVPNISDEQPRIVYDAYSQGLPVLATRTTGLAACVFENHTGWFAEPNSVEDLSRMIERAAVNLDAMKTMGMQALLAARSMTHQRMHRARHELLLNLMPPRN